MKPPFSSSTKNPPEFSLSPAGLLESCDPIHSLLVTTTAAKIQMEPRQADVRTSAAAVAVAMTWVRNVMPVAAVPAVAAMTWRVVAASAMPGTVSAAVAGRVMAAIAMPAAVARRVMAAAMPGTVSAAVAGRVMAAIAMPAAVARRVMAAAMPGTVSAAMAGTMAGGMTISRLHRGRSEEGEAGGDGQESDEIFHDALGFGLSRCRTKAACQSDAAPMRLFSSTLFFHTFDL
jgi:hypothetical protein